MSITQQGIRSLQQILQPVQADIARIDDILRSVSRLEQFPILQTAMEAIIAAGGKRLRPAVLFLAARFHNYDMERLLPMAAAIELLHTASLVHDDTIDRALLRRGLPTLNSLIDAGTTVLVGDYLFARSAVLSTMGGKQRATRIFAEALVTIAQGEIEQKFSRHEVSVSMDQYLKRIYSKTAALFAAAGEIGAVVSDAPEDEIRKIRHYSRQVGMAFQIVDDILDVQSTASELGKPTGGDLRQGTMTLPTMLYMEQTNDAGRERVRHVIQGNSHGSDLTADLLQDIVSSGAVERSHAMAREYVEDAKSALAVLPDTPERNSLCDLADFVVARSY